MDLKDAISALHNTVVDHSDQTRTEWRYYVHVTEIDGRKWAWATDGHRIHACRVQDTAQCDAYGKDGRIYAKSTAPPRSCTGSTWPARFGGLYCPPNQIAFPFTKKCLIAASAFERRGQRVVVGLDGQLVIERDFSKAEELRLRKAGALEQAGALRPSAWLQGTPGSDAPPVLAVGYFRDALSWTNATGAHYGDATDPVVLLGAKGESFALVMPVRL